MNKTEKSATGPISPRIGLKKQFNVVPVKPKNQEDKPWKANNSSFRNAMAILKVDSIQRNDLSKLAKLNRFQLSENGRPAPDHVKVSFSYHNNQMICNL